MHTTFKGCPAWAAGALSARHLFYSRADVLVHLRIHLRFPVVSRPGVCAIPGSRLDEFHRVCPLSLLQEELKSIRQKLAELVDFIEQKVCAVAVQGVSSRRHRWLL